MHGNAQPKDLVTEWQTGSRIKCRPFVKWAGGKKQLITELLKRIPGDYNRYFEPFVGGGALLFAVQPQEAEISDLNPELMNAYHVVRDGVEDLILDLKEHLYEERYYYEIRNVDRTESFANWSPVHRASRFIFLNRSCYNGLYRVNAKGQFNTPFGRYVNPTIVDADNLRACSQVLKRVTAKLADFRAFEQRVAEGDFVYFDPPYVPVSETAKFTNYTSSGFGPKEQYELSQLCRRLDARGVKFMLSNAALPAVVELYNGFKIETVLAKRAVNSRGSGRGEIAEHIVTNY